MNKWWFGEENLEGNYEFGTTHILGIVFVILMLISLFICNKYLSKKTNKKILIGLSIFAIIFEITWRVLYLTVYKYSFDLIYPFYVCNLSGVILPIIALLKGDKKSTKILKGLTYVFGFVGGFVTFLIPEGIFNMPYLTFQILKSILQHTFIICIPVYELMMKTYVPRLKTIYLTYIGMILYLLNAELMPLAFGQTNFDYLYLRSGLPFTIPGVPLWIPMVTSGVIGVFILHILTDFKSFISFFKRKKAQV